MLAEAALLVALTVQRGTGADACLDEASLKRNVEKRLRRRVFAEPAQASLLFAVSYARRGDVLEARVEVSSRDGARRGTRTLVTDGHCSKLDDSLSLSVALLADEPPEPEPALLPLPETVSPPPPPPPPRLTIISIPADVAAPRAPWHVAAGAALQGAWGVVPGLALAGVFSLRVVPPGLAPILLGGEVYAPRTAERDAVSGARFRLLRVALSLCPPLVRAASRELSLCFGQKVGWLRVDGFGFDHDLSERRLGYSLHAGAEARQRLFSPLFLRGFVGLEVPLVRDRFVSSGRDATDLFRPSTVGLSAQLGLEASLW